MIEKEVRAGPHLIHVEERTHKRTGKALPATQTFCRRPLHETYRCPHGEVRYCVGSIKPERSEIEELFHARFDCTCAIGEAAETVAAQRHGGPSH